jgi:ankyrin repeat protein
MNEVPPNQDQADEVDNLYRRESALDPSRPSESVRRAVLEHATHLAAERSAKNGLAQSGAARPAANPRWWRPTAYGTLAAAALAGLLIIPRFLAPDAPLVGALPTAPVRPNAAATAASQAEIREQPPDAMAEVRPQSPPPPEERALQPDESALKPRASSRYGATVADSAAEIAAKNAAAKVQSMINARSTAAGGGSETDARREQTGGVTAGIAASPRQSVAPTAPSAAPTVQSAAPAAQSAAPPSQSVASKAPAARLADSAAEVRRAAEIGAVPELQTLLGQPGDIDARDESGRTALMLATLHGQARAVDMLLAHGADPNAADAQGVSPLQAAIAGDRPAIAAALRRAGAR